MPLTDGLQFYQTSFLAQPHASRDGHIGGAVGEQFHSASDPPVEVVTEQQQMRGDLCVSG